jgi:GNAT superfamily N-acetyltransferase
MPINGIVQPEIINIDETLRLRAYDGNFLTGLPWYQNEVVYYNSEGITDKSRIPDEKWVERMYTAYQNSGKSEMYFIEVKKDDAFIPIGDVALQEENPPIVIGIDEYRGIGIGKKVMTAIINRARKIGIKRIYGTWIYDYNIPSQRLYESLGFKCVEINGNERIYELYLV